MSRLTLLVTQDCHLCEKARRALGRVAQRANVEWEQIDIAEDRELAREYGDRLPVILLDGAEHGYWEVEERRLLRDLGVENGT